jgi:uncharacterized surface protein with fasciclin (FAS1) repeats
MCSIALFSYIYATRPAIDTFYVNTSNLTLTDSQERVANLIPSLLNVQATNGVVHVIDKVILPDLGS